MLKGRAEFLVGKRQSEKVKLSSRPTGWDEHREMLRCIRLREDAGKRVAAAAGHVAREESCRVDAGKVRPQP